MKKKRTRNITSPSGRLTTSGLLKNLFAELEWALTECTKNKLYHSSLESNDGGFFNIYVDTDDEISFIRLMVFNWREVRMTDIEEVSRVQSAINRFNSISRAKVHYHIEDNIMQLSTILYCSFCEEIPDIEAYFFAQMETVLDARKFIFPSGEEKKLPWHGIPVSPQAKTNKEIVLDSLKRLNCKPDVELIDGNFYSIIFDYQTALFEIRAIPTNGFVLLLGPIWYSFDAVNVEKLSKVKSIVNELNWDSRVNVEYWIEERRCYVGFRVFLTCVDGVDFTLSLILTLTNCFHTRNMFNKMFVESSAR